MPCQSDAAASSKTPPKLTLTVKASSGDSPHPRARELVAAFGIGGAATYRYRSREHRFLTFASHHLPSLSCPGVRMRTRAVRRCGLGVPASQCERVDLLAVQPVDLDEVPCGFDHVDAGVSGQQLRIRGPGDNNIGRCVAIRSVWLARTTAVDLGPRVSFGHSMNPGPVDCMDDGTAGRGSVC